MTAPKFLSTLYDEALENQRPYPEFCLHAAHHVRALPKRQASSRQRNLGVDEQGSLTRGHCSKRLLTGKPKTASAS